MPVQLLQTLTNVRLATTVLNTPTVSTLSAPTGVNAKKATEETARLNAQVNILMFSGQHSLWWQVPNIFQKVFLFISCFLNCRTFTIIIDRISTSFFVRN